MIQFLLDVLIRASDLALIAVAMSAVYSLIKFPNIALVQYAVAGAMIAIALFQAGAPLPMAIIFGTVLTGFLAMGLDAVIFARLLRTGSSSAMIGSLAVAMIFSAVFLIAIGPEPLRFATPVTPPMRFAGVRITQNQSIAIGIGVLVIGLFALLLFKTELGRCMRATATNSVLAQATGVDTDRTRVRVVLISGMLAALGGICITLKGEVNIQMGLDLLLPVFAAAILGGLGNALGAVVGALIIAVAETIITNTNLGPLIGQSVYFLPAPYAPAGSFVILVLALLVRPHGIFVNEVKRV